jgi:hypothetical protein
VHFPYDRVVSNPQPSTTVAHCGELMAFSFPVLHRPSIAKFRAFQLKYFGEWWMLEILSWCFSAVCVGTIIIVLWYYNGRQVPQLPFGLTINGFVSLFAGIARSSLLLTIAELLGQLKWVSSVVYFYILVQQTNIESSLTV